MQEEEDRLDIMHKTFSVARGKLFSAPVNIRPGYMCNILDLGCGTGIWSIDVAEFVRTPSLTWPTTLTPTVASFPRESVFAGLILS